MAKKASSSQISKRRGRKDCSQKPTAATVHQEQDPGHAKLWLPEERCFTQ
tara:strand:+ start:386 stop:535 length:150 start_codon:yes stop_codon:yes gene_type:complete